MTDDISATLEAKSDQLNADDIIGINRTICISKVIVSEGDQPVSVYFSGDNGRPWKPSKGMRKVLALGWGHSSIKWVGKSAVIFCEPSVTFGGKAVGGVHIRAMSDIPENGLNCSLRINRSQSKPYFVEFLTVQAKEYPAAHFEKALPIMAEKMKVGEMTLQGVIAQCEKTGTLTTEQIERLEQAAPIEINDNEEEQM